jgi:hypothetical protein
VNYAVLRKRPRFSLLTLLLMTTAVALMTTTLLLYRELAPLRREVRTLLEERGNLYIEDATEFQAMQVATPGRHHWRWRVRVPPRSEYLLHAHGGPVPKKGYLQGGGGISLAAGEHLVGYRIAQDDESWTGELYTAQQSVAIAQHDWPGWTIWLALTGQVGFTTEKFSSDQLVTLLRHRTSATANSPAAIEDPAPGLLIWMEPVQDDVE